MIIYPYHITYISYPCHIHSILIHIFIIIFREVTTIAIRNWHPLAGAMVNVSQGPCNTCRCLERPSGGPGWLVALMVEPGLTGAKMALLCAKHEEQKQSGWFQTCSNIHVYYCVYIYYIRVHLEVR